MRNYKRKAIISLCALGATLCLASGLAVSANTVSAKAENAAIALKSGASIRLSDVPALRFAIESIDATGVDSYGIIAAGYNKETMTSAEDVHEQATNKIVLDSKEAENQTEDGKFNLTIKNIPQSYFTYEFAAVGYTKTADGVYTYSTFDPEVNVRTVSQVARLNVLNGKLTNYPQLLNYMGDKQITATVTMAGVSNYSVYNVSLVDGETTYNLGKSLSADGKISFAYTEGSYTLVLKTDGQVGESQFPFTVTADATQTLTLGTDQYVGGINATTTYFEDGSVMVKNAGNQWANAGIQFNMANFSDSNTYLNYKFMYTNKESTPTFQMYRAGSTNANFGDTKGWNNANYDLTTSIGDSNGTPVSYSDLVDNEWYEMYVEIGTAGSLGDTYMTSYIASTTTTTYIKDVCFTSEDKIAPNVKKIAALQEQITTDTTNAEVAYSIDDNGDAMVTVKNTGWRDQDWKKPVQFNVKDNIGDNTYLKFMFKYENYTNTITNEEEGTVTTETKSPEIRFWNQNGTVSNISSSAKLTSTNGVWLYKNDTLITTDTATEIEKGAGTWFTMYVQIKDKTLASDQYYLNIEKQALDDTGVVTSYVKNVEYVTTHPQIEIDALKAQVTTGANVTATYYIDDEGDAAVKLENKVPMGDGWAKSALTFTSTDMTAGTYLTFQFKFDALASGENPIIGANKFGGACKTNIFSENWYGNADACVIYTSDGTKITAATDLKAGTWYTMYAYISAVEDGIYISFYDSNSTTATGYIKNVELNVAALPTA